MRASLCSCFVRRLSSSHGEHAVDDGDDEEGEDGGGEEAADDDGGQGALHFGSVAGAQGHGQETEKGHEGGHDDRTQTVLAAFEDAAAEG